MLSNKDISKKQLLLKEFNKLKFLNFRNIASNLICIEELKRAKTTNKNLISVFKKKLNLLLIFLLLF